MIKLESSKQRNDLAGPIQNEVQHLSQAMKGYRWKIEPIQLSQAIVNIEMYRCMAAGIYNLCERVDEKAQRSILSIMRKLSDKINFARDVIQYLETQDTGIDPRLAALMGKLNDRAESLSFEKLEKYSININRLAQYNPNEISREIIQSARYKIEAIVQTYHKENTQQYYYDRSNEELDDDDLYEGQNFYLEPWKKPENAEDKFTYDSGDPASSSEDGEFKIYSNQEIHPPRREEKQDTYQLKLAVQLLQTSINALSQLSDEGVYQSIEGISSLNGIKFSFSLNKPCEQEIADRIYFHLYNIQKNENPQKINPEDLNWGCTAFQDVGGETTHEERLRAVQRVQMELLIFLTASLMHSGDKDDMIPKVVMMMEELKLHPKDLPMGKKNLAHFLFEAVFSIYSEIQKKEPQLLNPCDPLFKGDFGRQAFASDVGKELHADLKLGALQEVLESLIRAWQI